MNLNNELIQIELAKNNAIEKIETASKDFESKFASQKKLIDDTKVHLTEHIIEKSVSPLNRAIAFLGVIFTLLTLTGGVFTYTVTSSLKSSMETYIKHKVESWLSIDSENSLASRTLDEYRTKALLDAYMIKLARMSSSNGGGLRSIEFKEADKRRLLDIILSPESSDADFHDAVALLSVARGEWGYGRENDQIAVELRKVFSSETLSNNRKLSILETMRNDRSLLPVAEHIISDTNSPSHFRHQAFLMLKGYDSQTLYGKLANEYAFKILNSDNEQYITWDAVAYFASKNPLSTEVRNYINKIENLEREESISSKIKLISSLVNALPFKESFFSEPLKSKDSDELLKLETLIATLIVDLIESNAYLSVSDFSDEKYLNIAFKSLSGTTHSVYLDNLDKILGRQSLLDKVFNISLTRKVTISDLAIFFSTSYKREPVVTVGLEFLKNHPASIKNGNEKLNSGIGWIQKEVTNNSWSIHWHDKYGKLKIYNVDSVVFPNKLTARIQYNKNYIAYSLPYERLIF